MKQLKLKLPNVSYKFDVVIQNDYNPTYISDSFETLNAARNYKKYLLKEGLNPQQVLIQQGNSERT